MYISRAEDIPSGEHWAIIRSSAALIPGDERSRTNPGHGYPAHTVNYITYETFTNEIEFRTEFARVLNAKYGDKVIRGIHVTSTYMGKTIISVSEEVGDTTR